MSFGQFYRKVRVAPLLNRTAFWAVFVITTVSVMAFGSVAILFGIGGWSVGTAISILLDVPPEGCSVYTGLNSQCQFNLGVLWSAAGAIALVAGLVKLYG